MLSHITLNLKTISFVIIVIVSCILIVNMNYVYACPENGCNFTTPQYVTDNPSPYYQLQHSIPPEGIQCNGHRALVVRMDHQSVGCVTMTTAYKLQERGWGIIYHGVSDTSENVNTR